MSPTIKDRYQVLKVLGRGGGGIIYQAKDTFSH